MARLLMVICFVGTGFVPAFSSDSGFAFFPDSIQLIGKWDVSSSLGIDDLSKALDSEESHKELDKLRELGLDPLKDIGDAYFGLTPATGTEGDSDLLGVIQFNRKIDLEHVIREFAKWKNQTLEEQTYRGVTLFGIKDEKDTVYFTPQVKGEWCFAGSLTHIKAAIDRMHGEGSSVLQNKELMATCKNGTLPHLVWIAGSVVSPGGMGNYKNTLFTFDYMAGIQITGKIPYSTEEEKAQINQALSMGSGMIMMFSQGKMSPDFMKITDKDSAVQFNLNIPEEVLASLKEQAVQMQQMKLKEQTAQMQEMKKDLDAPPAEK